MKVTMSLATRHIMTLALAGFVMIGTGAAYVISKHLWARNRLSELEPRYARLIGLEASAMALETSLAERNSLIARYAYPSSQDVARASSDAQQKARENFSKAGLEVSSTQILPAKVVGGFDRIPVVLHLEGDLPAIQSALVILPRLSPSLFIESLNLQTTGLPKADGLQKLLIQVNLFVLRVR